ncbi:hypothetical protein KP509_15G060300 [Ceratopteris richardii]|nr:hypothetical protein KP509_15G060300 [Ceratopteris richardii]
MNAGDLLDGSLPSNAAFKEDIAQEAAQIAALLAQNGCPFTININPFLSLYNNNSYSVDGIFFDSHALPVEDGAFVYHNVFDISYDSLDVVLENAGYTNMEIIVGAIGWPTDGDIHANSSNAQRFNQGFLDHAANGTPRRPNRRIEFYMLSLIDEDMKGISQGNFQRHWGLFRYDGKPKYPLSLSANAEKLSAAVGVQYLPQQWCVLDTTIVDTSTLPGSITYACNNADCTALDYGGSCNGYLNDTGNASYAFNAYYQMQNQDVGACSFNGLGHIITDNPSNGSCEFIIQLAYDSSAALKQKISALAVALMVFLVVL